MPITPRQQLQILPNAGPVTGVFAPALMQVEVDARGLL